MMPEGPEVEIMRRTLDGLAGETLTDASIEDNRLLGDVSRSNLDALTGSTLTSVDRHGKYLLFVFPKQTLVYHPRMTGLPYRLSALDADEHDREQGRLVFETDTVLLTSIRRFSRLDLAETPARDHPPLKKLGPDLLTSYPAEKWFVKRWSEAGALKHWMLDQTNVAGIGNIYANDIAFEAKLHPFATLQDIADDGYARLFRAIRRVLGTGLENGGASISDFENPLETSGSYQEITPVYQREGEPCRECGTNIERLDADRPTFFCPNCQGVT